MCDTHNSHTVLIKQMFYSTHIVVGPYHQAFPFSYVHVPFAFVATVGAILACAKPMTDILKLSGILAITLQHYLNT